MRFTRLTVVAALVLSANLCAQPAQEPLDKALAEWEKAMNGLQTFSVDTQRTNVNKTFATVEVYSGWSKFSRGQTVQTSRLSIYLQKTKPAPAANAPADFEKFVCTGHHIFAFHPVDKVVRWYDQVQAKGQAENFMNLVFGMKAQDMKKRFQLNYIKAPPEQAKWYHFIEILPVHPDDKGDFTKARLVLNTNNHLPAQIWFQHGKDVEITWDFPPTTAKVNVEIPLKEFANPDVPKGWKLEKGDKVKARN